MRLLVFDRTSQTWSTPQIQVPATARAGHPFFGDGAIVGGDRLYIPANNATTWWSVLVSTGGSAHQVPGVGLAFAGSLRATTDTTGRLTVTDNGRRVMSAGPPAGCSPDLANGALWSDVKFAGTAPVVGYRCAGSFRTVVYNAQGRPAITLGSGVGPPLAANEQYVLLGGNQDPAGTHSDTTIYALDLAAGQLRTLPAPRDGNVAPWLSGSLASWDTTGPHDQKKYYDVIYRVDRLR
jgi:hypothetical protein